jgi:hypothetical protein
VGGSNPSLLKRSACLLFSAVGLAVCANNPSEVATLFTNLTGGFTMNTYNSLKAVMFVAVNSATLVASSVSAGLAANGLTPHL